MDDRELSDAEQHAQQLRRSHGLPWDIVHVRAAVEQAGRSPSPDGIPRTPAEAADIGARDALSRKMVAITERLKEDPAAWAAHAGVWIEHRDGEVLHVLTTAAFPAPQVRALCEDLLDDGVVIDEVERPLSQLEEVRAAVREVMLSRQGLAAWMTSLGIGISRNQVELLVREDIPSELIDAAREQWSSAGLVVIPSGIRVVPL